jgi:hypothetical protein
VPYRNFQNEPNREIYEAYQEQQMLTKVSHTGHVVLRDTSMSRFRVVGAKSIDSQDRGDVQWQHQDKQQPCGRWGRV